MTKVLIFSDAIAISHILMHTKYVYRLAQKRKL